MVREIIQRTERSEQGIQYELVVDGKTVWSKFLDFKLCRYSLHKTAVQLAREQEEEARKYLQLPLDIDGDEEDESQYE